MLTPAQRQEWISAGRVAGVAVLAALVAIFRFSPNYVLWSALGTPFILPEVARADDALRQLQHPFVSIDNYTNRVLQWRLFFPLLGRALSLPSKVYLALPHLGCLLVLIFIVRLALRRGLDWGEAFAMAALLATCSWFFVSTGLLGFFDSWYLLGLLVLVFTEDLRLAAAAVIVTPWIDERFVIMLPLSLLLRWQYRAAFCAPSEGTADWRETVRLGAALLPWLLIRVGALLAGHDPVTERLLQERNTHLNSVGAEYYLLGLWQGMRWAWIFVMSWLIFTWRQNLWRIWIPPTFLATLALSVFVAEDMSRSVSTLLPVIVLGVLLCARHGSRRFRTVLFGACALNFIFPAAHVVGDSVVPIRNFYQALQRTLPTGREAALYYDRYAVNLAPQGRLKEALLALGIAIECDPAYAEPYLHRAEIYVHFGRIKEALADANQAVMLDPKLPAAWLSRGKLRANSGDVSGAAADLDRALRCAPLDWPERPQTLSILKNLQAKTGVRP